MTINIANHGSSIVWDGIYYFALSEYPRISDWEMRNLILFVEYEKQNNRKTEIICEDTEILHAVNHALAEPALFAAATKPGILTVPACTNCKKGGCVTEYLCHTTEIQNAAAIFKCGKLLSAVKARGKPGTELARETRNAAKDTPDYFDYIMFMWGNCFAGDSLVMERTLQRDPNAHDLGAGLMPGVRFYFRYDDIVNHPQYANDGHHAAKIKHELSLFDYLHCCIIPGANQDFFQKIVPSNLAERVFYVENDCKDAWEWADKVYGLVCKAKFA